jgi:hypothetical protein
VAIPQLVIYNIQLPRLRELTPDFNDALYCWLYIMDQANQKKLTIQEVIEMTPELRTFMDNDKGFQQYCAQYHRAAADPETQDEYYRWINEQMRQQSMMAAAEQRGRKAGEEIGEQRGREAGEEIGEQRGRKAGEETGRKAGEEIGRKAGEEIGEQRGRKEGQADLISILNELGVSPDILSQAASKLDANNQN